MQNSATDSQMDLKLGRQYSNNHTINDAAIVINKKALLKKARFYSEESHSFPPCASSASNSYMV